MSEAPNPYRRTVWGVACPKCGAPVGQTCRTLKTSRATDTHADRYGAKATQTLSRHEPA